MMMMIKVKVKLTRALLLVMMVIATNINKIGYNYTPGRYENINVIRDSYENGQNPNNIRGF